MLVTHCQMCVLAMFRVHRTLTVAMAYPRNLLQIDELERLTGCRVDDVTAGRLVGLIVASVMLSLIEFSSASSHRWSRHIFGNRELKLQTPRKTKNARPISDRACRKLSF